MKNPTYRDLKQALADPTEPADTTGGSKYGAECSDASWGNLDALQGKLPPTPKPQRPVDGEEENPVAAGHGITAHPSNSPAPNAIRTMITRPTTAPVCSISASGWP